MTWPNIALPFFPMSSASQARVARRSLRCAITQRPTFISLLGLTPYVTSTSTITLPRRPSYLSKAAFHTKPHGKNRGRSHGGKRNIASNRADQQAGSNKSLRAQAADDLAIDLTLARSAEVFDERERSGAPRLVIASSAKSDLGSLGAHRNRRHASRPGAINREAGEAVKGSDHEGPSEPIASHATHNSSGVTIDPADIEELLSPTPQATMDEVENTDPASGSVSAKTVSIHEVKPQRKMKIARLRKTLGRVLFSPGVHPLRDPRSGVWNYEPGLNDIPPPEKFAFHRCPPYITPSQDEELLGLAQQNDCRFLGSTSTLTKALSQIYFAISGGKGVDLSALSQHFASERTTYTPGAELPACIILDQLPGGKISVDSDKRWDVENVISDFGRILEKLLTCEANDFRRFLTSSPESAVPEAERSEKEAYRYQRAGSLLMRSQLDCYDPRLPGSGVFDIKTRACLPIRYDRANYLANSAYDISKDKGFNQYYDLLRAGMLKFSLQVRIGAMDGIFLAYHNTSRLFGFQYIPLSEIDERLFGSTEMAEQAFKLSVALLEDMLKRCTDVFPGQTTNVTIKHMPSRDTHAVTAYVEPKQWDDVNTARPVRAITYTFTNKLDGEVIRGPVTFSASEEIRKAQNWSVDYKVIESPMTEDGQAEARKGVQALHQALVAMTSLYVPEGHTVHSMTKRDEIARRRERRTRRKEQEQSRTGEVDLATAESENSDSLVKIRWKEPGARQLKLREEAAESGRAYEERKRSWKKSQYAWASS
ncbi:hypothetical protein IAU60_003020 [Kwoniella sp. DSM 27419]